MTARSFPREGGGGWMSELRLALMGISGAHVTFIWCESLVTSRSILYYVSCISCILSLALVTMHLAPCILHLISCILYLASCFLLLAFCLLLLASKFTLSHSTPKRIVIASECDLKVTHYKWGPWVCVCLAENATVDSSNRELLRSVD